jgi:uncharacterized UPF0160 family protein
MQSMAMRSFYRASVVNRHTGRSFSSKSLIATHSGVFHCDEAMACCLLTGYTLRFSEARIVRSRDQEVIDQADVVVDVGGVYDSHRYRFDHHQRSFNETFSASHNIKLSSAGLVFKHFGRECIERGIISLVNHGRIPQWVSDKLDHSRLDELWVQLYDSFFVSIDAIDNGIDLVLPNTQRAYDVYKTDLASRVARLNLPWWEKTCEKINMNMFREAMSICDAEFLGQLQALVMSTIGSEGAIEKDLLSNTTADGQILVLSDYCAWKQALLRVEEKLGIVGRTKFVVYKDRWSDGWRVQGVPVERGSFESRCLLLCTWRGLPRSELCQKSGISNANFVHNSGFIGGAGSKESALKMADLSLFS